LTFAAYNAVNVNLVAKRLSFAPYDGVKVSLVAARPLRPG